MKRPGKLCSFQFGLLSGNIFHSFYFRLTPPKLPYLNIDVVIKKSFSIRFDMKKDKKEETMNPQFR